MKLAHASVFVVLASSLALVIACSSSDTGTSGTVGSSGTSGSTSDAGKDTGAATADAGDAGTAKKGVGETCTVDGDCTSDHCKTQGAGGGTGGGDGGAGRPGTYCTIFCSTPGVSPAAECAGALYTGKCSGKSFCEVK
ncbi:MAG: hypothetical protein QOI41_2865 [Myxococcales bacterium]|nr:hypothetical protein [Myxococcales bacterium]